MTNPQIGCYTVCNGERQIHTQNRRPTMYYGDTVMDNDHERFRQERASRNAARGWRFRIFESKETELLKATVAKVIEFVRELLSLKDATIRSTREQVSY
jgi:hypothetical protein